MTIIMRYVIFYKFNSFTIESPENGIYENGYQQKGLLPFNSEDNS